MRLLFIVDFKYVFFCLPIMSHKFDSGLFEVEFCCTHGHKLIALDAELYLSGESSSCVSLYEIHCRQSLSSFINVNFRLARLDWIKKATAATIVEASLIAVCFVLFLSFGKLNLKGIVKICMRSYLDSAVSNVPWSTFPDTDSEEFCCGEVRLLISGSRLF